MPINSVRDFPKFCGQFGDQYEDGSIGFVTAEEHHFPITQLKHKSDLTLGGSMCESVDDINKPKESAKVLGKRPLEEDNYGKIPKRRQINLVRDFPLNCGLFGTDQDIEGVTEEHHSPKSFGNEDNCIGVDDNNHNVHHPMRHCRLGAQDEDINKEADPQNKSTKSKNNESDYNEDDNDRVTSPRSNQDDQAKMSKKWEFEWVEVDRIEVKDDDTEVEVDVEVEVDDDDDISFLSPLEWRNLAHSHENKVEFSKELVEETKTDESKTSGNVPNHDAVRDIGSETKVQEVLNLYHKECGKLYGGPHTNQVHVKAAMILKKENMWLNCEKTFGHVPGVKIGDQFQFRAELVVVGLHHEFQSAISCATIGDTDYAVSFVDSNLCENKGKPSNVLTYTMQGGNSKVQAKRSGKGRLHQKGKLALKNSMDAKFSIRVIRKVEDKDKRIIYFYDGLYNVIRSWEERSKPCKIMFEIGRLENQPVCDYFAISEQRVSIKHRENRVVIFEDISKGKEKFPIPVVNDLNDETPEQFTYISEMIFTRLHEHHIPRGCDCIGGCSDLHKCSCVKKNKGTILFNGDGAILKAKKMIYECGPNCKCPPSCQNRVTQHGPKFPLEVFKTKSTGWGVRSREEIQPGSFICEYLGEVMEDLEADLRTNDDYLLDLDDGTGFTIDAANYGNVGRFINHSCSPNLYAQNVFYDHEDTKLPHVMFFATKTIPALQELTYHYDYKINGVLDTNGNIKKKKCCCGSRYCKKRLY